MNREKKYVERIIHMLSVDGVDHRLVEAQWMNLCATIRFNCHLVDNIICKSATAMFATTEKSYFKFTAPISINIFRNINLIVACLTVFNFVLLLFGRSIVRCTCIAYMFCCRHGHLFPEIESPVHTTHKHGKLN